MSRAAMSTTGSSQIWGYTRRSNASVNRRSRTPARESGFERWTAALSPALVARRIAFVACRTGDLRPADIGRSALDESRDDGVTGGREALWSEQARVEGEGRLRADRNSRR